MSIFKNRDWLQQAPFTLTLSSGFFGFYAHNGFLAALIDQECIPSSIAGSSAGAIVAAMHANGLSIRDLKNYLFVLKRQDFWDPALGFGLLKGKKMEEKLSEFLPESFSDLKVPLAISTFDLTKMKTWVINEGEHLITAVRASCALPGMFHPVRLAKQILIDGGVADDLALQGVPKSERVLTHYLQKSKWPNRYERWQLRDTRGRPELKLLTLSHRVFVGPHRLENGPDAFSQAYERTKSWLTDPA